MITDQIGAGMLQACPCAELTLPLGGINRGIFMVEMPGPGIGHYEEVKYCFTNFDSVLGEFSNE